MLPQFKGKTSEGKTTPVNSAVTAEMSLSVGKIPLGAWNYKITNFLYHKMYS
jgi:hypothetical protein